MNYRELQATLKSLRDEFHVTLSVKLNVSYDRLMDEVNSQCNGQYCAVPFSGGKILGEAFKCCGINEQTADELIDEVVESMLVKEIPAKESRKAAFMKACNSATKAPLVKKDDPSLLPVKGTISKPVVTKSSEQRYQELRQEQLRVRSERMQRREEELARERMQRQAEITRKQAECQAARERHHIESANRASWYSYRVTVTPVQVSNGVKV